MLNRPSPKLRLPAVLIFLWTDAAGTEALKSIDPDSLDGFYRLSPKLFALRPLIGDAGEVQLALQRAQQLLTSLQRRGGGEDPTKAAALVLPGEILGYSNSWEPSDDPLLMELEENPPEVSWGFVYLTGYAASRVEATRSCTAVGDYRRPSGGAITLFRLVDQERRGEPWRNPRLLGRQVRFVPRPAMEKILTGLAAQPVVRVSGPLGCGKTRLVWEVLGPGSEPRETLPAPGGVVWTNLPTPRAPAPPLALDLLRSLLRLAARSNQPFDLATSVPESEPGALLNSLAAGERLPRDADLEPTLVSALKTCARKLGAPLRLIFDDLQTAKPDDLVLLIELIQQLHDHGNLYFVLIARSGHPWPQPWTETPQINVPPLGHNPMEELAANLFDGLTMPVPVQRRFLADAHGCAFALEEGLIKLIHLRHLRRIYGSFFFGGNKDLHYEPSPRLVQHVEAELEALGESMGMRLLSMVRVPLPPALVAAAAEELGYSLSDEWHAPYRAAGWLEREEGPWGRGVGFTIPAIAQSLEATLESETRQELRRQLGSVLAANADNAQARWQAYSLVTGSPEGLQLIFELSGSETPKVGAKGLLDGLAAELAALRRRGKGAPHELQLLWRMLPLARRLGRLDRFADELPRAMELAADEPRKGLAFASLKTELDIQQGKLEEGEKTLRGALELVVEEDSGRQALLLLQLGRLLTRQNRHDEARTLFEQLLPVLRSEDHLSQAASCLFHLGNIALHQDRLDDAEELHQEGLKLRRKEGNERQLGASMSALGATALAHGDYGTALERYTKAEPLLEALGDPGELSYALLGRGRVLNRLGEYTSATLPLARALELRQGLTDTVGESIARLWVAANRLDLGSLDEALSEARKAHFALSLRQGTVHLADVDQLLGRIQLRRKNFHQARTHLNAALTLYHKLEQISSVLVCESLQLERALKEGEEAEIRRICRLYDEQEDQLRPLARRELVYFRLYQGHAWLEKAQNPKDRPDPLCHLRRAYAELMRKATHLKPEQRNRFLFQVEENAAIVNAATAHQLSLPG
ncbi:MAG: tetratricopeptide repeat protein [Acidobacteriota bacterium]|nr:tetratricopeptide repeat protein [Acidobacteriota bacterium]